HLRIPWHDRDDAVGNGPLYSCFAKHHPTNERDRCTESARCFRCKHRPNCQCGVHPDTCDILCPGLCTWLLLHRHANGLDLAILSGYNGTCAHKCSQPDVPDFRSHNWIQGVQCGDHESCVHAAERVTDSV